MKTKYLEKYFKSYGKIEEIKIIINDKTKKSKGFAMVAFKNPVSREILNTVHNIQGIELEIREYLSEEEAFVKLCYEKTRKIFAGGLPLSIDSKALKKYFE